MTKESEERFTSIKNRARKGEEITEYDVNFLLGMIKDRDWALESIQQEITKINKDK